PLFLCALRTGLRLGELLGLQWGDVDFHGRFVEVRRNLVAGRITTPKSGRTRRVDMSAQLAETLKTLLTSRKVETLRKGWPQVPDWVFCNEEGGPLDGDNLRHRAFYKTLARAGLLRGGFPHPPHSFPPPVVPPGEGPGRGEEQGGGAPIHVNRHHDWPPTHRR